MKTIMDATIIESLREELDEHLDAINSNTSEIQASYDYIAEVESKVDKLNEKMDKILRMLEQTESKSSIDPLTLREQEVFLALYTDVQFMTVSQVAKKIMLTDSQVNVLIDSIIAKGVPILKRFEGEKVCLQIEPGFRSRQTKENILQISQVVMSSIS